MRNAQRAIGIVAAAAVAAVLGLAAPAEEPKPTEPGSGGQGGGSRPEDSIKVRPGGGHSDLPTLAWECVAHKEIKEGKKGELGDDLLLGLKNLQVRATDGDAPTDARAVRFAVHGGAYTIVKDGGVFKWTADTVNKLKACSSGVNCVGYHGIPPELITNATMTADIHGTGKFVPIVELWLNVSNQNAAHPR